MDTFYDYIAVLFPFAVVVVYFICHWIYKFYNWICFKNKYPILSDSLPARILSVGDIVFFKGSNKEYEYRGINTTDDFYYVFMSDDSVTPVFYRLDEIKDRIDAIYGRSGIKWKRL